MSGVSWLQLHVMEDGCYVSLLLNYWKFVGAMIRPVLRVKVDPDTCHRLVTAAGFPLFPHRYSSIITFCPCWIDVKLVETCVHTLFSNRFITCALLLHAGSFCVWCSPCHRRIVPLQVCLVIPHKLAVIVGIKIWESTSAASVAICERKRCAVIC